MINELGQSSILFCKKIGGDNSTTQISNMPHPWIFHGPVLADSVSMSEWTGKLANPSCSTQLECPVKKIFPSASWASYFQGLNRLDTLPEINIIIQHH